jgi:hypothetical protein
VLARVLLSLLTGSVIVMCIVNRFVQPWKPWWGQSSISNTVGSSSGSTSKSLIQEISTTTAAIDNTTTSTDAQQQQQQQQRIVTVQHSNAAFDEQIEAAAVEDTVTDDEIICEEHTPQALITAATAAKAAATSSSVSSSVIAASALIKHVLLDVLCAYAYTLRLYNGCWCCDPIQVHKLPYTAFFTIIVLLMTRLAHLQHTHMPAIPSYTVILCRCKLGD